MNGIPLVSLCIPTNGVIEWVDPVLESVYSQGIDEELFEVVVTDNGNDLKFRELMEGYRDAHENMVYSSSDAPLFLNEIESYKCASAPFIKFVNHRTMLVEGALDALVSFARDNLASKPSVYFSNGNLGDGGLMRFQSFDSYVKSLSIWSSWSTGMGFWKEDLDRIPVGTEFNELFPHTTILFSERRKSEYLIDDRRVFNEIPATHAKKGEYDLYYAFAVEYPAILLDLCRAGDISQETFLKLKEDNLRFIASLYFDFNLMRKPCSYDLTGYSASIGVFYSRYSMGLRTARHVIESVKRKVVGR